MEPMMLTDSQRELYEQARDQIEAQVPGWREDYASDPAVAVLELGVTLADLQNEMFDQIQDAHYMAYLKLLGTCPDGFRPASLWAKAKGTRPYPGQRFQIGGLSFEVAEPMEEGGVEISSVLYQTHGSWERWSQTGPLRLSEGTDRLHITFDRQLPAGRTVRVWCGIAPEAGRNPPNAKTPPPICLQARGEDGSGLALQDGTCGLLRSGLWTITAGEPVSSVLIKWDGDLEGEPRLFELAADPVLLFQRQTRSAQLDLTSPFIVPKVWWSGWKLRFFLRSGGGWQESTGLSMAGGRLTGWKGPQPEKIRVVAAEADFPGVRELRELAEERVVVYEDGVFPGALRVMVEESGLWYDVPIREPDREKTLPRGCRWDGTRHALCFGDGRDFQIPKEGKLLISGCVCTGGGAGNGAGGSFEAEGVVLKALAPASGGRNAEAPKDAFARAMREQEEPLRAVTMEDYERISLKTPGLWLKKVQVVARKDGPGVLVLAMPRGKSGEKCPELSQWQRERLQERLERARMIGVPVTVLGPRYVQVQVTLEIQASKVSERVLKRTLLKQTDGVVGPLGFGAELSREKLHAALGAVPGVRTVQALTLSVEGVRQDRRGRIQLEPDMLPYLKDLVLTVK